MAPGRTRGVAAASAATSGRVRRALAALFAAAGLQPALSWAARPAVGDVVALSVCVIDADIRSAAIARKLQGAVREDVLRAAEDAMPDAAYRAQAERLVKEVFRARIDKPRPYVAERLAQCVKGATPRAHPEAADGCYQLTRYANDFFAARRAGVPLDNVVQDLRSQALSPDGTGRLAKLAASVYQTTVAPPDFRAGLFFHCVKPGE
jgi:hypothetical protein